MLFHKLKVGDRVILARVLHDGTIGSKTNYRGLIGTVVKLIKCRETAKIKLDNPPEHQEIYEAKADNLDLVGADEHKLIISGHDASCSCRMWSVFRVGSHITTEDATSAHETHLASVARRKAKGE